MTKKIRNFLRCRISSSFLGLTAAIAAAFLLVLSFFITPHSLAAQIRIAWDPNTEPDLAGYKVFFGTTSQSYGTPINVRNVTSYTVTGLTAGRTYFLAVRAYDTSSNESGFSNEAIGIATEPNQTVISSSNTRQRILDYDGDGRTDIAVYRPGDGKWYVKPSSGESSWMEPWGQSGDIPVPGDYDGDGKTDIAVYRPGNGTWHIKPSSGRSATMSAWGGSNFVPVPGDYDGDGKTDIAVYRSGDGTWHIKPSSGRRATMSAWGGSNFVPVPGDYDGDGKTDIAVYRPEDGAWYLAPSSGGTTGYQWGGSNFVPVPGDYDGDGKTDIAVYRPEDGAWYLAPSSGATTAVNQWGGSNDFPLTF